MSITAINKLSPLISTTVATYADLNKHALASSLVVGGFTQAQAEKFNEIYELIDQLPNVPYNGFSAAVFKEKTTGKHIIAMRGTEVPVFPWQTWLDLIVTDASSIGGNGFANNQAVEMYRYYKQLTTVGGQPVQYSKDEKWRLFAIANSILVSSAPVMPLLSPALQASFVVFEKLLDTDTGVIAGQPAGQSVLSLSEKVDVTGHSLGGHLAMLFQRFFPNQTDQVVTLNAPGFFSQGDAALSALGFPGWDQSNITRIEADGDGVSEIGTIWPGSTIRIAQENGSGPINALTVNHSSVNGNDSLSLMAMMAALDPTLANNAQRLSGFLRAASNMPERTYESTLDTLRIFLLGGEQAPTVISSGPDDTNRAHLYDNLYGLMGLDANGGTTGIFSSLQGNVQIVAPSSDGRIAKTDFGAFLSLYYLAPFALKPTNDTAAITLKSAHQVLAAQWDADRLLNSTELKQGKANFSDEYLTDRAAMLSWLNKRNSENQTDAVMSGPDDALFRDISTNTTIRLQGGLIPAGDSNTRRFLFGGKDADSLSGGTNSDRLYGHDGNDVINGQDGHDYLEGNVGDDTLDGGSGNDYLRGGKGTDLYKFQKGDGWDTIIDSDGSGKIDSGGNILNGGKEKTAGSGIWFSNDKKYQYALFTESDGSKTLNIVNLESPTDRIFIKDFTNNKLGIDLQDGPAPSDATTRIITGDRDFGPEDDMRDELFNPTGGNSPGREDTLTGSTESDRILGLGGRDFIKANGGNDIVEGGIDADIIEGGEGDDRIYGISESNLADALEQGRKADGNGAKGDWLNGSRGDDIVIGSASNDVVLGGAGRDTLVGGAGDDVLSDDDDYSALGFDWSISESVIPFSRILAPFDNNNSPESERAEFADVLYGGAGNDLVAASHGKDTLYGESGNDTLSGGDSDDLLSGSDGDDRITGDYGREKTDGGHGAVADGNDYLDGGVGNDWLQGDGKDDQLFGGDGDDTLYGDASYGDNEALRGNDYIDAGDGKDTVWGGGGNDIILGGKGDDHLYGDATYVAEEGCGDDYVDGEAGNDHIEGHAGNDALFGGDDNDSLIGGAGNDTIDGGSGNDAVNAGTGNDVVFGGIGDDSLTGDEDNDYVDGEEGNDIVAGNAGDDTLTGGSGADTLLGNQGNDTYLFHLGDGADSVIDSEGENKVVFEDGISLDDIKMVIIDGKLVLVYSGSDSIVINGTIRQYIFSDGTAISAEQMMAKLNESLEQVGNDGNDHLIGGSAGDALWGGKSGDALNGQAGNDYLYGEDGADVVTGGAGRDVLFGQEGNDILHGGLEEDQLVGGDGTDLLYGEDGDDKLWGQEGNDSLYGGNGNDELIGNEGDDWLDGGRGDDVLYGDAGSNTYVLNIGDGHDLIAPASGSRHIHFGPGITLADLKVRINPVGAKQKFVQIKYGDSDDVVVHLDSGTLDYHFDDGTVRTHAQLVSQVATSVLSLYSITGTEGDNLLQSSGGAAVLNGGGGNDRLLGSDFDDQLLGGSNNDSLFGGSGNDLLDGGTGDDLLEGGEGNDTLQGGVGNDTLKGGAGSNTYKYAKGDGNDIVIIANSGGTSVNKLQFTNLLASDLSYSHEAGGSLKIRIIGTNDAIDIPDWYTSADAVLQQIEYADGSVQDLSIINAIDQSKIVGQGDGDHLTGTQYSDVIIGSSGNDVIDAGTGNDESNGGAGADTYLMRRGMGLDTVVENTSETNFLKLDAGLALDQLILERRDSDLYVHFTGTSDGVMLKDYYSSSSSWVVLTADGLQKSLADLLAEAAHDPTVMTVAELRNNWIKQSQMHWVQNVIDDINAVNSNNPGWTQTYSQSSPYNLTTTSVFEGGSTFKTTFTFGDNVQYSDQSYIERASNDFGSQSNILSSYTVKLPKSRYSVSSTAESTYITDYGTLDNNGMPTVYVVQIQDGLVSENFDPSILTYLAPAEEDGTIVVTRQESVNASTTVYEHIVAGASDNAIQTWGAGVVDGGGGNDVIWAQNGSDPVGQFLYGGQGNDFILNSYNDDMVIGGDGDDFLAGNEGNDTYYLVANETGTKIIDEVAEAWRVTQIADYAGLLWNGGARYSVDTVEFGAGIKISDLHMRRGHYASPYDALNGDADGRTYDTLDFSWGAGQTARVLLSDPSYDYASWVSPENDGFGIEYFKFADGTVRSMSEMQALMDMQNAHTLQLWNGDGAQVIPDFEGVQTLSFGPGISAEELVFNREGNDLILTVDGMQDTWRFTDWYLQSGSGSALSAAFSDGTVWDNTVLQSKISGNLAPVLSTAIADQSANDGQAFAFQIPGGTFADPNFSDVLALNATLDNGDALPAWLIFDPNTRTFSGIPDDVNIGSFSVKVTATDPAGLSVHTLFNITVNNVNEAPVVVTPLAAQTANASKPFNFTIPANVFADPDAADALSYKASLSNGNALPAWLTFDAITHTFSGTPEVGDAGKLSVQVTVRDLDGMTVSQAFSLTITAPSNLTLSGTAAADTLIGGSGNDFLDGAAGVDKMVGQGGDDTYMVDNTADAVIENVGEGIDTVQANVNYVLANNVENLTLTGISAINGTGNALDNILIGNGAANILKGGLGNDTYYVGTGDTVTENAAAGTDTIVSTVDWTLSTNLEKLILAGSAPINGVGNTLANHIQGNAANNMLNGGSGADTLIGGAGDDIYTVGNVSDVVTESVNEGTDTVFSNVNYTLTDNVENLTLTGSGNISAHGNTFNNVLTGNAGKNVLDGDVGADTLIGGKGDDAYVVDDIHDSITENVGEGKDTVLSIVDFILADNVENLTLNGTNAINGTGNASHNLLTGNSVVNTLNAGIGNDTLVGAGGADTLIGGLGNDTYIVDDNSVSIVEEADEGTDVVKSSVSYVLSSNLENVVLQGQNAISGSGNALNNTITGNTAVNMLYGFAGNDKLDGGGGSDTLIGGEGDDTYFVNDSSVVITEMANGGKDTVRSTVEHTLVANVENLLLLGNVNINGTGNNLNNSLTGNSGNNLLSGGDGNDVLNGGGGEDTLLGGLGNDTYVVNNNGALINEALNEGTDTVKTSLSFTLSANVENMVLQGTENIDGTGNDLNNALTGNAGNNLLVGGEGNDTLNGNGGYDLLVGGVGNDVYIIDSDLVTVNEDADSGIDTVKSKVSYTLGDNVENLTLTGSSSLNGFGNALNNVLTGNSNADLLEGYAGNDTVLGNGGNDILRGGDGNDTLKDTGGFNVLDGGAGADALVGKDGNELFVSGSGNDIITTGSGSDIIAYNRGDGQDVVLASTGTDNTISLGGGIRYEDIAFRKSENDLILELGGADQITLKNWYSMTTNHSVSNLQVIVEAMSDYDRGSSDVLKTKRVEQFNFSGLVDLFDQARATTPGLTHWTLTSGLLDMHLSGSDSEALGGDLAYHYGKNGTLSGLEVASAQAILGHSQFGMQAQAFQLSLTSQANVVKLS